MIYDMTVVASGCAKIPKSKEVRNLLLEYRVCYEMKVSNLSSPTSIFAQSGVCIQIGCHIIHHTFK